MTKSDLFDLLTEVITGLDAALRGDELLAEPPTYQLIYALRKHLSDQQGEVLKAIFDEENAAYRALTATIEAAANGLERIITDMQQINDIILYVTKISADVDQVLKLAP